MTDAYTPRLLAALRSRSFGDAADLIESQAAEIAKLKTMLDRDREESFVVELFDAGHEPGQFAANAIVEYLNDHYDFGDGRGDVISLREKIGEIVGVALSLKAAKEGGR
jgi:hypothetical protein